MASGSSLVLFRIEVVERPQNSRVESEPIRSPFHDLGTGRSRNMMIVASISVAKVPSGSSPSGKSHPRDPSNPPEIARKANLVKYLQFC